MYSITKYVGFDVSKEKIAVAVADFGITSARFFGLVENSLEKIRKILKVLVSLKNHVCAMRPINRTEAAKSVRIALQARY